MYNVCIMKVTYKKGYPDTDTFADGISRYLYYGLAK